VLQALTTFLTLLITNSQALIKTFFELFVVLGLCWGAFSLGELSAQASITALEQTDHCYDTRSHEAWIATKNGEARCFMEQRSYPHRVRASHLDIGEIK